MNINTTLVTACYDLTKYHSKSRDYKETVKSLHILLKCPMYLVIFTDHVYIDEIRKVRKEYGYDAMTIYVVTSFEELWCARFCDMVDKNRSIYWPTRDERTCTQSMLLMYQKFDFVERVILENPFKTERVAWIDANLNVGDDASKRIKICESYTNNILPFVLSQIQDDKYHIQILNVTDKRFIDPDQKKEYYSQYRWVMCGSFFVTGLEIGLKVLKRLKDVALKHTLLGYGHGDEMLYIDILDEFPDEIVRSYGDYNQILNNLIYPTRNIGYIVDVIIQKYFQFGYHRECIDCCQKVLYSFDHHLIEMNDNLYCTVISYYYQSCCLLLESSASCANVDIEYLSKVKQWANEIHMQIKKLMTLNSVFCEEILQSDIGYYFASFKGMQIEPSEIIPDASEVSPLRYQDTKQKDETQILKPFAKKIQLIISRYGESLHWLQDAPFNKYPYIVYNKGVNRSFLQTNQFLKEIPLPNVGREAHTYLYHINQNYHELADITVFLPGSVDSLDKLHAAKELFRVLEEKQHSVLSGEWKQETTQTEYYDFTLDYYLHSHHQNKNENSDGVLLPSSIRPFGKWYDVMFNAKPYSDVRKFNTSKAMFALTKEGIHQEKPRSYYETLLNQVSYHPNPEAGHYFERSYATVFSPITPLSFAIRPDAEHIQPPIGFITSELGGMWEGLSPESKSPKVTFVTAFYEIYEKEPVEYKGGIQWRIEQFEKLLNTGIQLVVYSCLKTRPYLEKLLPKYPETLVLKEFDYSASYLYRSYVCRKDTLVLPSNRHHTKDTYEFLMLQNAKMEFIHDAIQWNPYQSTHFAWIDFSIAYIFKDPTNTFQQIQQINHLRLPNHILIPGCNNANVTMEQLLASVCWKYCGGFFIGDKSSLEEFYQLYVHEFPLFLDKYGTCTWEVNFWAYLTIEKGWQPIWYEAGHDDSMLDLSFVI